MILSRFDESVNLMEPKCGMQFDSEIILVNDAANWNSALSVKRSRHSNLGSGAPAIGFTTSCSRSHSSFCLID